MAVPKYLDLKMQPASSDSLPAGGTATQVVTVTNKSQALQGVFKPMMLRGKLGYEVNGAKVEGMHTFSNFPAGL